MPPDVADQLRSNLKELTLFLDTNFLFGILDLHANPLVDVSQELLRVTLTHHLPFKLRYHEATEREMLRTIHGISSDLKGRHWPQAVSRAAAASRNVSGIERRFHEENARRAVDPEEFFKPLGHMDVLLKEKGILIYRQPTGRQEERADLLHAYREFLEGRGKQKPYESIDHDVTVLDAVRSMRSSARSSLEARALCVTCDYLLTRFDWETARTDHGLVCTVLPNQLLQLVRPFLPSSSDFDRSFANSFAIPEFRTVHSGATVACSKMLAILASYKGIREETAAAMLANDVLLDKLKQAKTDAEFHEQVESAIVDVNSTLLEETVALKRQLQENAREQEAAKLTMRKDLETAAAERRTLQDAKASVEARVASVHEEAAVSAAALRGDLQREMHAKEDAEARARKAQEAIGRERANTARWRLLVATLVAILTVIGVEIAVRNANWSWLLLHDNSYAIRGGFGLSALLFWIGLLRRDWRTWCWGTGCFALIVVLLSLLGGPGKR